MSLTVNRFSRIRRRNRQVIVWVLPVPALASMRLVPLRGLSNRSRFRNLSFRLAMLNLIFAPNQGCAHVLRKFFELFIQGIGMPETELEIRVLAFRRSTKLTPLPLLPGRPQSLPGLFTLVVN